MKRVLRLFAGSLLGLALAMTATLSTPAPVAEAAVKYVVDDNGVECTSPDYFGINGLQDAITAAISHKVHTIEVCPGTYSNVVIVGANGLKIVAKSAANRPRIDAPATDGGTIVDVRRSNNVTLVGLYLNGDPFVDGGTNEMNGVVFRSSNGVIQDMVIYGIASLPDFSSATARAISVIDNDGNTKTSTVKVAGNYVNTYQTAGIYAEGRVKVTLTGNTLMGQDHLTLSGSAPTAGIALVANLNGTPTGSISKNFTYYNLYGIALSTVPKIKISGNAVDYSIGGVLMEVECFAAGSNGDLVRIAGNRFTHITSVGVGLVVTTTVSSPCASHANGVVITGNMIHANANGQPAAIGGSASSAGTYAARIDKMQITKNTAWGYTGLWTVPGATHTITQQNKVLHW